jgi:Peptidase A4 family
MTRSRGFVLSGLFVALASVLPIAAGGGPTAQGPNIRLRQGTSSNWSGYAAAGAPGSFTSVAASWTQPLVSCTSQRSASAYWVGLDGDTNSTVEQLGTEGNCNSGQPQYYAWFEMYPHRSYLVALTVTPRHVYAASVTAQARGSYLLHLADTTTGVSFNTVQKLNSAQNASAEVIAEAPSSGGILPLANFGTVNFSGSTADGKALGSFGPEPITMQNPYGMKATPSNLDPTGQAFSIQWSAS